MRLKSLEIKGFKSFADKTTINLDNQITGIVGPNGCGKSNIVDAIRWVIGEHKIKQLRSDNLEDLVFNGSKSRNASGLAEVSITFDNTRNLLPTEFNTVTITRKFYKNGESEYRLNNVNCRLKDITNLFLDTGISSDSYAIIELGMVDDIIKDKDGSRRRMLEQAAGISIYKTRKKEAKLRLDATEQDLNRIEDLLFEISNNLRTLEAQAKKAEKYFIIKNEYKTISIELVKAGLEDFNATYQTLNSQQQEEVDKIIAYEAKIAAEDADLQKLKTELIAREQTLKAMQESFNTLVEQILKLENEKSLSKQRLEHLLQLKSNTETFLKEAESQTAVLANNIKISQEKIIQEKSNLTNIQDKVQNLRTVLDQKRGTYDKQKEDLETERKSYQTLQIQLFDAEKKVAVADNTITNINYTINQIAQENNTRTTDIGKNKETISNLEKSKVDKEKELADLITKRDAAKENILKAQALLEDKRNDLMNENRTLDAKTNEHKILKELVDKLEGYPDSIKFLKNNTDWNIDAPLLSEIITVKEDYRVCIENYLDYYLNYYIVANSAAAYSALQLLDSKQKGKAGFIILDELNNENKNAPTIGKSAINVASANEKYKNLVQHLLQNVAIVDTEIEAVNYKGQGIVIAKSGKSIKISNTLKGGAIGSFEGNRIGREQRLNKLTEEINALQIVVAKVKEEIKATQESIVGFNNALNDNLIRQTEQGINQFINQAIQLQGKNENFDNLIEQSNLRAKQLQEQLTLTKSAIAETKESYNKLKQSIDAKKISIATLEKTFAVAEGEYNKASDEYNTQNLILTKQQSTINELSNEVTIRIQQQKELIEKIDQSKKQQTTTVEEQTVTEKQLKEIEEQYAIELKRKEVEQKALNEFDQKYYTFRNEINTQETELNAKRKEKEMSEGVLSGIKEKLTDMRLQLSGMKERLQIEFKLDVDEVLKGERETDTPVDQLKESSDKLKKRLDNLGEINPTAIEAFKEVKGRYDFIQEQKNDLVTAKESLMATIQEVEQTANARFLETFHQVRENFINVFHALFTDEDNCDLKLEDPDNPADTAIEIYAQPKGKRPSTITQLSGGEKTLTSTAFLFAIYLIKPAPFCVLDEVDAPLDDANVAKFTQMIRKFSDRSQFIIVTHNKQTMASVDVVYGVTMQEAGVSKLVPVDFRSLE